MQVVISKNNTMILPINDSIMQVEITKNCRFFTSFSLRLWVKNICLSLLHSQKFKMLEININIRLNNTAVTSFFHWQKINKMHAIQHTVLRNVWPMALEKPTRRKPVRERESCIISWGKNQTFIYSQNPTYLNPVGCLVFCANDASISVQFFSWKMCQNSSNL